MGGVRGSEREPASFPAACSASGGCGRERSRPAGKLSGKGRRLLPLKASLGLGVAGGEGLVVGLGASRLGSAAATWLGWGRGGGNPLLSLYSAFVQQHREKPVRLTSDICISLGRFTWDFFYGLNFAEAVCGAPPPPRAWRCQHWTQENVRSQKRRISAMTLKINV